MKSNENQDIMKTCPVKWVKLHPKINIGLTKNLLILLRKVLAKVFNFHFNVQKSTREL